MQDEESMTRFTNLRVDVLFHSFILEILFRKNLQVLEASWIQEPREELIWAMSPKQQVKEWLLCTGKQKRIPFSLFLCLRLLQGIPGIRESY